MPNQWLWVLTEEGRRVVFEEMETAIEWIKAGADVFEKYGFEVTIEIKEKDAE